MARDHLLGHLLLAPQCPNIDQPPSSQFAFRPTTRRVPPRAQPQGAQVMLGLRWNQFEIKSLSAPVRAHGLRRQVMQSLRSNRSNSTSHLSILPCVISKNKNEIDFDTNAPPSLTTSQHGGQRPPVGAPPGAPDAPPPVPQHCPTSLKPFAFRPTTRRVM